jgi:magnesium transporter
VAGVYGMNFEHMPELHWRWGYLSFWAVMVAITGVQLLFMRRKHWF